MGSMGDPLIGGVTLSSQGIVPEGLSGIRGMPVCPFPKSGHVRQKEKSELSIRVCV
jgi:hypothetical protein